MSAEIRGFRIDIPQSDLDDLHDRLARTRWAPQLPGADGSRGVPVARLRELAEYWRTEYDWRAQESRLNRFPQYRTEIDGVDVHFLHVRSPEPGALPLVLNHGWPSTFAEFAGLVDLLVDPRAHGGDPARAFHVVVPSVPGYGFSAAPSETGWSAERVGRMWVELMRRLGYARYGVQGGDLGTYVGTAMAEAAPDRVAGLYITAGLGFPTEADVPMLTDAERAGYEAMMAADWVNGVDHHGLLRAAPQTFSIGWNDSPAAALAWMVRKYTDFSAAGPLDAAIDRDALLTTVGIGHLLVHPEFRHVRVVVLRQHRLRLAHRFGAGPDRGVQRRAGHPPPRRAHREDRALARGQSAGAPFHRHGSAARICG